MRIYFTRHGESEANTLHVISNRNLSHSLTRKGYLQAISLAGKLQGRSISRIYSSPIPRARETSQILSTELGVPLECVDALREPDCGVLEGRGDASAWVEHDYWMASWSVGREKDNGPQGGETYTDVRRRFADFITRTNNLYGDTASEFILVTHGALLQLGLPGTVSGVNNQFIHDYRFGYTLLITTEVIGGRLVCLA